MSWLVDDDNATCDLDNGRGDNYDNNDDNDDVVGGADVITIHYIYLSYFFINFKWFMIFNDDGDV